MFIKIISYQKTGRKEPKQINLVSPVTLKFENKRIGRLKT